MSTLLTLQSIDSALTVIFCALTVFFRFLERPTLTRPTNRFASAFLSAAPRVLDWEATMAASAAGLLGSFSWARLAEVSREAEGV